MAIHISEWHEHDPKRTGSLVYLFVTDADAIREEWLAAGVEGRIGEAFDAEAGASSPTPIRMQRCIASARRYPPSGPVLTSDKGGALRTRYRGR